MAHFATTVDTDWDPEAAFGFVADLRNLPEWDPGVRAVRQVAGEGSEPDATFEVDVAAPGRDMVLRYRTVGHDAPREALVVASTAWLTSEDRITVAPRPGGGSAVTYDADLRLHGPLRLLDPALRLAFGRIGARAEAGLRRVLALPAPPRREAA